MLYAFVAEAQCLSDGRSESHMYVFIIVCTCGFEFCGYCRLESRVGSLKCDRWVGGGFQCANTASHMPHAAMTNSESKLMSGQKRPHKDPEKKITKKEKVKQRAKEICDICDDHPEGYYAGADSEDDVFISCPSCGNEGFC